MSRPLTVARSRRCMLTALLLVLVGCARTPVADPDAPAMPPLRLSLEHLRHLGIDVVVRGTPVRAVALYAEAPDYKPSGSPARDGYEGIASVDDAARTASACIIVGHRLRII